MSLNNENDEANKPFLDVKEIARQKSPDIKDLNDLKSKLNELNKKKATSSKIHNKCSSSEKFDEKTEIFVKKFKIVRFIIISGMKLKLSDMTLATAATIFHKFFSICKLTDFDPYLIASASIYLASKIEEENLTLRDIVNVCYRTLHRNKEKLNIGEVFWSLRNSIIQIELLIVRVLSFKLQFEHPHKYLLVYLESLRHWIPRNVRETSPIPETCWHMLRDLLHSDLFLRYRPQEIAISIIYLVTECYGIKIPYNELAQKLWWKAFDEKTSRTCIHQIMDEILEVYEIEDKMDAIDFN